LVIAFFANPANLPRLMPAWQQVRVDHLSLRPPPLLESGQVYPTVVAGDGTRLTLTLRPIPFAPIRLRWLACIEDFRWNESFCDVQLHGPFRSWRQCHLVRSAFSSRTPGAIVEDRIDYELPLGALGTLANQLIVRRQIAAVFRHRQRRTAELLPHFAASVGWNQSQ
jgi:ligand-binding SRPBCC domain-containing protein